MIAVVQRSLGAKVTVGEKTVGEISQGLLVLLGVGDGDTPQQGAYLAEKIVNLRIFEDDDGKMNRSLVDVQGQMLVVSQFTLLGDCKKGRRPSFVAAAPPEKAEALYLDFVDKVKALGIPTATGVFGAMMDVSFTNNGPVTLIIEGK